MEFQNLIGQRFNCLTVIRDAGRSSSDGHLWVCECDCGNIIEVSGHSLRSGNTKSCGHLRKIVGKNFSARRQAEINHYGTAVDQLSKATPRNSSTGIKGVSRFTKRGQFVGYRAYLFLKGKQISGGVWPTIAEAAQARKRLEAQYFEPIKAKYEEDKKKRPQK